MNPNTPDPTNQPPTPEVAPVTEFTPAPEVVPVSEPTPTQGVFPTPEPSYQGAPVAVINDVIPPTPTQAPASDVLFPGTPEPVVVPEAVTPVVEPTTAPMGSGSTPVVAPESPKMSKKTVILLASIIGGVILLAAVGILLYVAFFAAA